MDASLRLTLAIRLPQNYGPALTDLQGMLRRKAMVDLRMTAATEFFVPIVSLGEQSAGVLHRLDAVLKPVFDASKPFELGIQGLSGQPNLVQPRYANLSLSGQTQELERLHNQVVQALAQATQLGDGRLFNPFITLARLRQESEQTRVSLGRAIKMLPVPPIPPFTVTKVLLLNAVAGEGVGYVDLREWNLGS